MPYCLIALGSNLGDRACQLRAAVELLKGVPGVKVSAVSTWHETEPVGGPPGQPGYLNAALRAEVSRSPHELLREMQTIEGRLGRGPHARWGARPIDLDLLLYGDLVLSTASLQLPHPWMAVRRFVLAPAAEVAADMVHPAIGWSVRRLLGHLTHTQPYIAVAGVPGVGKTRLIQQVLAHTPGRLIADPASDEATLGRRSNGFVTEVVRLRRLGEPASRIPANSVTATHAGAIVPGPCANPAGKGWQAEIEFVRRRALRLDRRQWSEPAKFEPAKSEPAEFEPAESEPAESEPAELSLSDFWFCQSLAYGRLRLTDAQCEDLSRIVSRWQAKVQPHRVLVLLEPPGPWLARPVEASAGGHVCARTGQPAPAADSRARLAGAAPLRARAAAPGQGPVLRLDARDIHHAASQVLAAVQAMS